MSQGIGNVIYTEFIALGANGAAVANNGLSVFGGTTIQLGGLLGSAGAAVLLNNREIPLAGFGINLTGVGAGASVNAGLIFKDDATKPLTTPQIKFQDSTGAENGRIQFIGLDVYIGNGTGIALTVAGTGRNTVVGQLAGQGITTGIRNTLMGDAVLQTADQTSFNTAIGSEAMRNYFTGVATGSNSCLGYQALFNLATGVQNVAVGNFAGAGFYLASSDNVLLGFFAGARTTSAATAVSQAVIIGSNSYSANAQPGTGLIAIGYNINAANQTHGNNIILIGASCVTSAGNPANSTAIGAAMDIQVSNVCVIGRTDQNVIIGSTVTNADNGSKLQVLGSLSLPRRTTAVNTTLTAADFTLILTAGALVVTLPTAAAGATRIYAVVNQAAASTFNLNYTNFAGAAVNTIAANAAIWIQSDGANWIRIA